MQNNNTIKSWKKRRNLLFLTLFFKPSLSKSMNHKEKNLERELKELLPKLIIATEIIPIMEDLYERYELLGISQEKLNEQLYELVIEARPDLEEIIINI